MKKLVALLLTFCMLFTMSTGAFALPVGENILRTLEGTYYCYSKPYNGDMWEIIIYHPNNSDVLEFTTKPHSSNNIYSTEIVGTSLEELNIEKVISDIYCNRINVKSINVLDIVQKGNSTIRTAVEGSMKRELRKLYGNEYSGKVLATYNSSSFPKVSRIQVKEDLFFRYDPDATLKFWFDVGVSVAEIALTIYGVATPKYIDVVIGVVGVGGQIAEKICIERHTAIANYGRYSYVNGGSHIYTTCY